jgi:ribose-phosphate pyrophosphokinase
MIVLTTQGHQAIAKQLKNCEVGQIERKMFPDGEKYLRILNSLNDQDVVILGGGSTDQESLELYDLTWSACQQNPKSLKVFFLYFGYSTMERLEEEGEVVRGLSRASLFDSLPRIAKFYTLDIHSLKINEGFKRSVKNLNTLKEVVDVVNELKLADYVIASPDEGRSKFIIDLSKMLNVSSAYLSKKRISGEMVQIKEAHGDVANKDIVLYDDMIRSGTTLIKAAECYKKHGAKRIFVVATHGVFDQKVLKKLKDTNLFDTITVSDSHPQMDTIEKSDYFKKFSIIGVIEKELEARL